MRSPPSKRMFSGFSAASASGLQEMDEQGPLALILRQRRAVEHFQEVDAVEAGLGLDGDAPFFVTAEVDHGSLLAFTVQTPPPAAAACGSRHTAPSPAATSRAASTASPSTVITSPSHCWSAPCTRNCVAAASSRAVGRKDQLEQPAAERRPVDALARRGEEHLLDHVPDVRVRVGRGRPAAAFDVVGISDLLHGSHSYRRGSVRRSGSAACRWAHRSPGCPSAPAAARCW